MIEEDPSFGLSKIRMDQPTAVVRILDPHSALPEALRIYLLGLGVKTLLIIPLTLGGQANGQLSFRFTEGRDFDPEELEIARALAIPASLARPGKAILSARFSGPTKSPNLA